MSQFFTDRLRVRAYECDSFGHVHNAVYLQYLQQATLDALGVRAAGETFWNIARLAIEYQTPARYGDELILETWPLDAGQQRLTCGYRIRRAADGVSVVKAHIEWTYHDRATHQLITVPLEFQALRTEAARCATPLKPFSAPRDNGARPFRWRHTVQRHELDATGCVSPAVYFRWMESAFFHATGSAGWTLEKMRAENLLVLQYRHDADFFGAAQNADDIEIISRLIDIRRVRGTWVHELYRTANHMLLMRDYSTGAFLDWQGNVRAGPMDVLETLTRGEAL